MTQKELLYVEDAVEHEKSIIKLCNDFLNKLDDDNLKDFITNQINSHEDAKSKLLSLLEEEVNGY